MLKKSHPIWLQVTLNFRRGTAKYFFRLIFSLSVLVLPHLLYMMWLLGHLFLATGLSLSSSRVLAAGVSPVVAVQSPAQLINDYEGQGENIIADILHKLAGLVDWDTQKIGLDVVSCL